MVCFNFCDRLDYISTRFFRLKKTNSGLAFTARRYVYDLPNDLLKMEAALASWLARWTPDLAVYWVRALAADILLCSCVRQFTLTVRLSTQVYKWVPGNLMLGVALRWISIPSRGEQKYS